MKVIILLGISHDKRYSMENYALSVYRIYHRLGFDVSVQFLDESVRRSRLLTFFTRYLILPIRSFGINSDIVHVVDHSLGHIVPFLRCKTIYTIHDLIPLNPSVSGVGILSRISFYLLVFLGLCFAYRSYCVSKFTSEQVEVFYPFFAKIDSYYHVLYSLQKTTAKTSHSKQFLFDILLIGNQSYKNNRLAVHLLTHAKIPTLNVCTLNMNNSHLLSKLRERHFLTCYSNVDNVNLLFSQSKIFLCLSKLEGFGYLPFEASVYGCCPVMSDIPIFRELHNHSKEFMINIESVNETKFAEMILELDSNEVSRSKRITRVRKDLEILCSRDHEDCLEKFIYSLAVS